MKNRTRSVKSVKTKIVGSLIMGEEGEEKRGKGEIKRWPNKIVHIWYSKNVE